nr:SMC-Scp complex subunit ScpB [Actinoplanes sp. N902-109]
MPPFPGEAGGPATVDAPQELPGEEELDPTDVGVGPELPLPGAIEEAADNETGQSPLVDAPLPPDGDDAGDVFDQAADDDVSDDAEVDLPVTEEVPLTDDEPDEPAAESVDSEGAATDSAAGAAEAGSDQPADGPSGANNGVPTQKRRKKVVVEAPPEEDVELKPLDEQELRAALESILLVVDEPVAEMQLAQIMEQPTERIAIALEDLSARYTAAGSGIDLRRAAGGWRFYTRPEFAPYVERFVLDGQSVRLTQAALETLAVVAYKQPVTRSRISAIRGVNCDGVMRTLVTRGLIEECGTEGETGAFLYRTTALFLEKLGLNSVDQLPPLAPFLPDDVEEVLDASG